MALAVGQRPSEPVELGDDQRVAVTASCQSLTQTRPLPIRAGQPVIDIDPVEGHTQRAEAITLGGQVLLIGGASGIISAYSRCLGRAKFIRSSGVISCNTSCLTPGLFL